MTITTHKIRFHVVDLSERMGRLLASLSFVYAAPSSSGSSALDSPVWVLILSRRLVCGIAVVLDVENPFSRPSLMLGTKS
jgi:hypothetical protein